jgi:hypothetical protein
VQLAISPRLASLSLPARVLIRISARLLCCCDAREHLLLGRISSSRGRAWSPSGRGAWRTPAGVPRQSPAKVSQRKSVPGRLSLKKISSSPCMRSNCAWLGRWRLDGRISTNGDCRRCKFRTRLGSYDGSRQSIHRTTELKKIALVFSNMKPRLQII